MKLLDRFRAVWTDGKGLVIHAQTLFDARELAERLEVPAGVKVLHVSAVR